MPLSIIEKRIAKINKAQEDYDHHIIKSWEYQQIVINQLQLLPIEDFDMMVNLMLHKN